MPESAIDQRSESPKLSERAPTKSDGTVSTMDTVSLEPEEVEGSKEREPPAEKAPRRWCLLHWLRELYASFGNFVPFAILTYGVNQSIAWAIGGFALRFYMKDVLGLDGATMGRLTTAAGLPWNMKPFMGMLSDGVALCGYHRRSYIVVAAAGGFGSYVLLGTLALPAAALVVVMIAMNLSVSTTDVIVDGKGAELSRQVPHHASDLQSLFWGVGALFSLVSSSLKGSLIEWFSPQTVLLSLTACSVSLLLPALWGWLPEERIPHARCLVKLDQFRKHPSVSMVAVLLTLVSTCLSSVQVLVPNKQARAAVTVLCAAAVATQSYRALKQITPYLGRTALFIFLRQSLQVGLGETMFVWLTKYPEGPQLSPSKLGFVDCFGSLGLLIGVCIYNKYMTNWSFRRIFLTAQISVFFAQLLEIVLVMRWNLFIGIPDFLFLVGDDTFGSLGPIIPTILGIRDVHRIVPFCLCFGISAEVFLGKFQSPGLLVSRFFFIPMCVLAAKVCPPNLEATLFATLLSLSNFGGAVSGFMGVTMCEVWGLEGDNFENLPYASLAKACFALLPVPLIFALTPTFTPNDPVPENEVQNGESQEPASERSETSQAA